MIEMDFDSMVWSILNEKQDLVNQFLESGFGIAFPHLPSLAQTKLRQMLQLPANFEMDYLLLCVLSEDRHYYMTCLDEEVLLPLPIQALNSLCTHLENLPKISYFEKASLLNDKLKTHLRSRQLKGNWLKSA